MIAKFHSTVSESGKTSLIFVRRRYTQEHTLVYVRTEDIDEDKRVKGATWEIPDEHIKLTNMVRTNEETGEEEVVTTKTGVPLKVFANA
tara:strand:+ start:303 stop:569 length:267 start_codon:yes stop_codon:yes gene_type:complete